MIDWLHPSIGALPGNNTGLLVEAMHLDSIPGARAAGAAAEIGAAGRSGGNLWMRLAALGAACVLERKREDEAARGNGAGPAGRRHSDTTWQRRWVAASMIGMLALVSHDLGIVFAPTNYVKTDCDAARHCAVAIKHALATATAQPFATLLAVRRDIPGVPDGGLLDYQLLNHSIASMRCSLAP